MSESKFAVLTSARTGSTWLIDLLDAQPEVSAYGELLLARSRTAPQLLGRTDFPRFVEVNTSSGLARVSEMFSYLNRLYRQPGIVGFKVMYTCLRTFPEISAYFVARRVRIIHLERENLLDILVSEQLARVTGTSHITSVQGGTVTKVRLDLTTLPERLARLEARKRQVRRLIQVSTCPFINVTYERLLESDREFSKILNFLGVKRPLEFRSTLSKRAATDRRESISNFDEVRRLLLNSRFGWMLD